MAIDEVSVTELSDALEGGARVFDVREPDEYTAGHVAGAVLIPLATVGEHLDEFRGADTPYVICKSGGRSRRACEVLEANGITAINVAGGTMGWIDSGREVVTGDSPA